MLTAMARRITIPGGAGTAWLAAWVVAVCALYALCSSRKSDFIAARMTAEVHVPNGVLRGYTCGALVRSFGVVTFTPLGDDERIIHRTPGPRPDDGIATIALHGDVVTVTTWNTSLELALRDVGVLHARSTQVMNMPLAAR